MPDALLALEAVEFQYRGLRAVDGVSFDVAEGTIEGLIGPNGAGKSTTIDLISGRQRPFSGRITFRGQRIDRLPPDVIARQGLIRTFQLSRALARLTVFENLCLAAQDQPGESLIGAVFGSRAARLREQEIQEQAWTVLGMFALQRLADEWAGSLSGGQRRLLELARAMMANPHLLLLDEPMAGVAPALVDALVDYIRGLNQRGVTILLVEHNLKVVERLCGQVTVMAQGRVAARGTMAQLRENSDVLDAYLGAAREVPS